MKNPMLTMAKTTGMALLLITALLLGACASSQPAKTAAATSSTEMSKAAQYQQAVHKNARANNAQVHWVHPPDEDDLDKGDG